MKILKAKKAMKDSFFVVYWDKEENLILRWTKISWGEKNEIKRGWFLIG